MCQDIRMPGSWLNTIHAVKDGKAISNRDDKANDETLTPGAVCLCQHSNRDILHLIVDNLIIGENESIKSLVVMREYPGGTWLVEMTKFQEDDDDSSCPE